MTLKYMQGFETMRDDSDLRSQGWVFSPNVLYTAMYPSGTTLPGTALHPLGAFSSSTTAEGAAGANDFAYFNTGVTVNQAWNAGGFTFGINAKFNSAVAASYAAGGGTTNSGQMCFDGSLYWAIRLQNSTYSIATSPDLINWTVVPTLPAAPSATSMLSAVGSTIYFCVAASGTSMTIYYTNNRGVSWSSQTVTGIGSGNTVVAGAVIGTGNSSFPHVVFAGWCFPGANQSGIKLFVGTVGGTLTAITGTNSNQNITAPVNARPRINNGLVTCFNAGAGTVVFQTATASNAALNTDAAWTNASATLANPNDIVYNPTSNLWVVATSSGISTFANVGGTPSAPSGTLTVTSRYSAGAITSLFWTGTQMIGVGQSGAIITSPDGVTWTAQPARIMPAVNGYNWAGAINDGTQYVLYSSSTTGVVATTPDLLTNFQAKYVMDSSELFPSPTTVGILSVLATAPFSGSTFSTPTRIGCQCSGVSSGNRTIAFINNATSLGTTVVPVTNLWHYYEIKATSVPGTTNLFSVQLRIDNIAVVGPANVQFVTTADTTSIMVLNLNRSGQFTAYDDIYLTLDDGVANTLQGPLGTINIVVERPDSDVQAQWTKTGGGATNASAVSQSALSSTSAQYVSSNTAGDKDVYATSTTVPAGYTAKAQIVEAYFTKTSTTAPTVNVGIKSGTSEVDGQTITVSGSNATYVSLISDVNPNGNVPWNNASINASDFVINHVS